MDWDKDISIESFRKKIKDWNEDPKHFIGDPPIFAQYALDLIFKELVDDKENYPYLTTIPENNLQINSIMLHLILEKYSRKYRKLLKEEKRKASKK